MADGTAPDVGLGDLVHFDRSHYAGRNALFLERILKCQRIYNRRQHAHMVARHAIHILCRRCYAAEKVAAAYYEPYLHSGMRYFRNLGRKGSDSLRVKAE